jgi:hypothetical protein
MKTLFLLLISMNMAHAEMSDCMKMTNQNDKNYCMATYSGSATYCDKIVGYERQRDCMRKVIEKQRSKR